MGPKTFTPPPPGDVFGPNIVFRTFQALTARCIGEPERIHRCVIDDSKRWAVIWRFSMRKIIGLALVAGALLVSACNTVEGMGKDVSSAGDTVAKTADSAK